MKSLLFLIHTRQRRLKNNYLQNWRIINGRKETNENRWIESASIIICNYFFFCFFRFRVLSRARDFDRKTCYDRKLHLLVRREEAFGFFFFSKLLVFSLLIMKKKTFGKPAEYAYFIFEIEMIFVESLHYACYVFKLFVEFLIHVVVEKTDTYRHEELIRREIYIKKKSHTLTTFILFFRTFPTIPLHDDVREKHNVETHKTNFKLLLFLFLTTQLLLWDSLHVTFTAL